MKMRVTSTLPSQHIKSLSMSSMRIGFALHQEKIESPTQRAE